MERKVKTFKGVSGVKEATGTFRPGELRGIIRIDEGTCVGCDTCRSVCPAGEM